MDGIRLLDNEEELIQNATRDITQLCAGNVILWTQFLETATLDQGVIFYLAKEHHISRVSYLRFMDTPPRFSAIFTGLPIAIVVTNVGIGVGLSVTLKFYVNFFFFFDGQAAVRQALKRKTLLLKKQFLSFKEGRQNKNS